MFLYEGRFAGALLEANGIAHLDVCGTGDENNSMAGLVKDCSIVGFTTSFTCRRFEQIEFLNLKPQT
jgi:hypothetical protein